MPETMSGSIDVIIDINHDNHFDAIKARNAGVRAVIHKASEGATFRILLTAGDGKTRSPRDCCGVPTTFPVPVRRTSRQTISWPPRSAMIQR